MTGYVEAQTIRLAAGAAQLGQAARARHAAYAKAAQRPDGGFAGREGPSDLYYTGFGLRVLSVLGELYGPPAARAAAFLETKLSTCESLIDMLSLLVGSTLLEVSAGVRVAADAPISWTDAIADRLEQLRCVDGGYAKTAHGATGSTYHSFLALLCYELIGRPVRQPERIVDFLLAQRTAEGGFREIRVAKRASTNPTAAAIGALRVLGALDKSPRDDTIGFLVRMQTGEGGFRANTRVPLADLLSTFTAVSTLADLQALDQIHREAVRGYVAGLEHPEGGFRGAVWDTAVDVEYTFYGLGCLALLTHGDGTRSVDPS